MEDGKAGRPGRPKRPNKYNAQRMHYAGRSFASKGERDCFCMLQLMERAGEIDSIECQVTSHLTAGITHKTDFKYWDLKRGETVWAEYKGMEDARWRIIRKLWHMHGPGRLRIYKGYGLRVTCTEEIIPDKVKDALENAKKEET